MRINPVPIEPISSDAKVDFSYRQFFQSTYDGLLKGFQYVDFVKDLGADNTGVTDVTSLLQKAVNDLGKNGGGTLYLPKGTYKISGAVYIGNGTSSQASTYNGIRIIGDGAGTSDVETIPNIGITKIVYSGSVSGNYMLNFMGPMYNGSLSGVVLDCAGLIAGGIYTNYICNYTFEDIHIKRWRSNATYFDCYKTSIPGVATGSNNVVVRNLKCMDPNIGTNASGCVIGAAGAIGSSILDIAQWVFINCSWQWDGISGVGNGVIFQFTDNCTFINCYASRSTGGSVGNAIYIVPPSDNQYFPSSTSFYNCAFIGGFNVSGTWNPNDKFYFLPLSVSDDLSVPSHRGFCGVTSKCQPINDWPYVQPRFKAYASNGQSISATTFTKVDLVNEVYDTNTNFSSSRFTPTAAGYYHISATANLAGLTSGASMLAMLYKNGVRVSDGNLVTNGTTTVGWSSHVSDTIFLNGTTDYIELYVWTSSSGTSITGGTEYYTFMSGTRI